MPVSHPPEAEPADMSGIIIASQLLYHHFFTLEDYNSAIIYKLFGSLLL